MSNCQTCSPRLKSVQDSQRIVAIVDKRAPLPAMLIVLARSGDLAEETIFLIVDPGGEEEFVSLACCGTIPKD